MSGYVLSAADRQNLQSKYLCSFCEYVLRDPRQTACGHFYCRLCAERIIEPSGLLRCIRDDTLLMPHEVFSDNFMKREVLELVVSCPIDPMCIWSGAIRHLEEHEKNCLFFKMECPNYGCTEVVHRLEMKQHLEECTFKQTLPEKEREEKTNIAVAEGSSSANGRCLFDAIGCRVPKTLTDVEIQEHATICSAYHLGLLLNSVLKLETDFKSVFSGNEKLVNGSVVGDKASVGILTKKLDTMVSYVNSFEAKLADHGERISYLEKSSFSETTRRAYSSLVGGVGGASGCDSLSRRLTDTENSNASLGLLIAELNDNINELGRKFSQLETRHSADQQTIRRLQVRLDAQDNALGVRNVTVSDLENRVESQSLITYDGVLLWRITDFARKRNEAFTGRNASFYSPPFYSSRYGYKMCARIYLNGDGMGKGTHVSLFFVLMRGEYDALLRWPFRQKVTLMLLDQDNVEHLIDAFRPDPASSSFQKPRREMNVASGCPLFCPRTELDRHAYIRDDVMFIKVIVDTSDV